MFSPSGHSSKRNRFAGVHQVPWFLLLVIVGSNMLGTNISEAGELTVLLSNSKGVIQIGAFHRWDEDGNPRIPVDSKAKIDSPRCTVTGRQTSPGQWVFADLPTGTYDLVIMLRDRVRIEGFHYPPVLEFDEFLKHAKDVDTDVRKTIAADIAQSRHYENKVTPLYMSGDAKIVRVLVQLLRDKPTSYDGEYGEPVATLRHEVWQFTNSYGAWTKERRTRVLDRVLMGKRALRQWTWVWVPQLGGIDVGNEKAVVRYRIPERWSESSARGLLPY